MCIIYIIKIEFKFYYIFFHPLRSYCILFSLNISIYNFIYKHNHNKFLLKTIMFILDKENIYIYIYIYIYIMLNFVV